MNERINAWFNSGMDYQIGLAIYEEFGTSFSLKRILRVGGFSKKNLETLKYELRRLNKTTNLISKTIPPATPQKVQIPMEEIKTVKKPVKTENSDKKEMTPETANLKKYVIGLLKERDYLHANLEFMDLKKRKEAAQRILKLSDDIASIYDRLDHFDKHGILPPEKSKPAKKGIDEMDTQDLMRRQMALRTYLTKYRKKLNTIKDGIKRLKYQDMVDKYQLELDDIARKLSR
jgi:hypothetical protein